MLGAAGPRWAEDQEEASTQGGGIDRHDLYASELRWLGALSCEILRGNPHVEVLGCVSRNMSKVVV